MLVLGVSRLWYRSLNPRFEGEREVKQVAVHQRYVEDSISLFLLYFLQLAVMAAYLNQDLLKLVPLLTIVFAFGRYRIPPERVGLNLTKATSICMSLAALQNLLMVLLL